MEDLGSVVMKYFVYYLLFTLDDIVLCLPQLCLCEWWQLYMCTCIYNEDNKRVDSYFVGTIFIKLFLAEVRFFGLCVKHYMRARACIYIYNILKKLNTFASFDNLLYIYRPCIANRSITNKKRKRNLLITIMDI